MIRISIVLVSLIYLLGSCRATKKIQSAIVKKDSVVVAIPPINNGREDSIAQIRMYKDSIIWVSITAILGIEGLRAYITTDSVKVLDKQNKIYIARSVAYLQDITALPLNLSSLQDLLIGNPVFLDSNIISYSKSSNSVSLHGISDLFKMLITIGEPDNLLQSSKLDDLDEQRNRTSYLTYSDYENKKGVPFSKKRTITVSEKKKFCILPLSEFTPHPVF